VLAHKGSGAALQKRLSISQITNRVERVMRKSARSVLRQGLAGWFAES
jgi:hypothetical protein